MSFLLEWDKTGEHLYETGVDHGVLFPQFKNGNYDDGVAWNGLTGVTESPSGGDPNNIYADNIKYLVLRGAEDFGGTITCYTYPDEWEQCDGSAQPEAGVIVGQQTRKPFGLCYRTRIGSDTEGDNKGYKLHIVYNASASPSERAYSTVNDSPEAIEFSYEFTTTPVAIGGNDYKDYKPISVLTIDSTKVETAANLATLESILYGTAATTGENPTQKIDAWLPKPEEIIACIKDGTVPTRPEKPSEG